MHADCEQETDEKDATLTDAYHEQETHEEDATQELTEADREQETLEEDAKQELTEADREQYAYAELDERMRAYWLRKLFLAVVRAPTG